MDLKTEDWIQIIIGLIAFIALIRPEIKTIFKSLTASIDFNPSGNFEIGFSSFGPTISIEGAFIPTIDDILIKNIDAKIVRQKDKAEHLFSWAAFRSSNLERLTNQNLQIRSAHSFWLSRQREGFGNIIFSDKSGFNVLSRTLKDLQTKFLAYELDKHPKQAPNDTTIEDLYSSFHKKNLQLFIDNNETIGDLFYWEPGIYNSEVIVDTNFPSKKYKFSFNFEITEEDKKSLKLNIQTMQRETCGIKSIYAFAYPEYKNFRKIK